MKKDDVEVLLGRAVVVDVVTSRDDKLLFGDIVLGTSATNAAAFLLEKKNAATREQIAFAVAMAKPTVPEGALLSDPELLAKLQEENDRLKSDAVASATRFAERLREVEAVRDAALADANHMAAQLAGTSGLPQATTVPVDGALLVVTARSDKGRWRCGRFFTREPTLIARADLSDEQLMQIASDAELAIESHANEPEADASLQR